MNFKKSLPVKKSFFILLSFIFFSLAQAMNTNTQIPTLLKHSKQLIVVVAPHWESTQGRLFTFQRNDTNSPWHSSSISTPIVLGTHGMGWGYSFEKEQDPTKQEGDYRSPAGVFALGKTFGFQDASKTMTQMPYIKIAQDTVCVDDPASTHYGQVINAHQVVQKDWNSAEQMKDYPEYLYGIVIKSNPQKITQKGSCIFVHLWDAPDHTTAGCTAMPQKILKQLIAWLNPKNSPVLVQLPFPQYQKLQEAWKLPHIGAAQ